MESMVSIRLLAQEYLVRNDRPRTEVRLLLDIIHHILSAYARHSFGGEHGSRCGSPTSIASVSGSGPE